MPDKSAPKVICLTPVKNEAWILDRFIQCASLWADHIIIADQLSDDGSRDIARAYAKVTLIENNSPVYDEGARQKLLLDAARQIPGKRLFITLDADEMLTANWADSAEWEAVLTAPEGTVITFNWVNVAPDLKSYWLSPEKLAFGFMDDGSDHTGSQIHSTRIPIPAGAPFIDLQQIKVLHYQYTNWERMESKQRWYQCWERVKHPAKRPIAIFRQYHHMYAARDSQRPLQREWLAHYEEEGIDMTAVRREDFYRWDLEVLQMLIEHGAKHFRKLAIWDRDWVRLAAQTGHQEASLALHDPRNTFEKRVHHWLLQTQGASMTPRVRLVQRCLRLLGW